MEPVTVGYIGLGVLVFILFTGMPIGFAMALIGFVGMSYISGFEAGYGILQLVPYRTVITYGFSVIPLFLLMGQFSFQAGISTDLYYASYKWLGHVPGGLAMATIGGCAMFAAICGSSTATAATMCTVSLPEMRKYNYDNKLATGCISAGGTIGVLIPPSLVFIIYGIITEQSIGRLFLAGIFPGLLLTFLFIGGIYVMARVDSKLGPRGPKTTFREKIVSLKGTWMMIVLFLLVIGGIYLGFFSPTEAGGIGAFGALLFLIGKRRYTWQNLKGSLFDTVSVTAMIMIILLGAMVFSYFLAVTRLPFELVSLTAGLGLNPYIIMSLIIIFFLIAGCFMDIGAVTILFVPLLLPLVIDLGFDPIWFGVVMTIAGMAGMITPPVGVNVFVIAGMIPDVPMYTIFRGIVPFFALMVACIAILVAVPEIALFLPNMMIGE